MGERETNRRGDQWEKREVRPLQKHPMAGMFDIMGLDLAFDGRIINRGGTLEQPTLQELVAAIESADRPYLFWRLDASESVYLAAAALVGDEDTDEWPLALLFRAAPAKEGMVALVPSAVIVASLKTWPAPYGQRLLATCEPLRAAWITRLDVSISVCSQVQVEISTGAEEVHLDPDVWKEQGSA